MQEDEMGDPSHATSCFPHSWMQNHFTAASAGGAGAAAGGGGGGGRAEKRGSEKHGEHGILVPFWGRKLEQVFFYFLWSCVGSSLPLMHEKHLVDTWQVKRMNNHSPHEQGTNREDVSENVECIRPSTRMSLLHQWSMPTRITLWNIFSCTIAIWVWMGGLFA